MPLRAVRPFYHQRVSLTTEPLGLTAGGLVRYFTLFVIDIETRRVHITGTTTNPTSEWMEQVARNLTDCEAGFLVGERVLIIDRDAIFSRGFKAVLRSSGVDPLVTAY